MKSNTDKKQLGDRGEDLAVDYLEKRGFTIVERNYRARQAEIDIICEDLAGNGDLVFIEVKTRTSASHGSPLDSIGPFKLNHVKRAASHFLYERGIEDRMCRFDVIGVRLRRGIPQIEHLRDVLEY